MWQQNVQQGTVTPLDDWVKGVADETNRSFWFLERHDELIERWAAIVGRERVIGVVVDDEDHDVLMRSFEGSSACGPARSSTYPTRRTAR